jgi:hypothetical protein
MTFYPRNGSLNPNSPYGAVVPMKYVLSHIFIIEINITTLLAIFFNFLNSPITGHG